jgi:hypothetical protein
LVERQSDYSPVSFPKASEAALLFLLSDGTAYRSDKALCRNRFKRPALSNHVFVVIVPATDCLFTFHSSQLSERITNG